MCAGGVYLPAGRYTFLREADSNLSAFSHPPLLSLALRDLRRTLTDIYIDGCRDVATNERSKLRY